MIRRLKKTFDVAKTILGSAEGKVDELRRKKDITRRRYRNEEKEAAENRIRRKVLYLAEWPSWPKKLSIRKKDKIIN